MASQSPTPIEQDFDSIQPDNVITIDPTKSENYVYASVNSNDTVSLFTVFGDKLDIKLDQRNWKNLKWNEDFSRLSMMGVQENDIFDLLIYEVGEKESRWVTNYYGTDSGVNSYIWGDNNTIYFNQGEGINNWLHKYFVPSRSERIKVERIDGEILDLSPDGALLIYRMNSSNKLIGYNKAGNVAWKISEVVDQDGNSLNIQSITFVNEDIALLEVMSVEGRSFYRVSIGGNTAVKVINKDFIPLCTVAEDFILVFSIVEERNVISRLNVRTGNLTEFFDIDGNFDIDLDSIECAGTGKILFRALEQFESEYSWFSADASQLTELAFLKGAREVEAVEF
ncbi:MAG: hypothetical protein Kow0081_1620 [Candidatus Dojkabacteria bacterium]